jgi:hypothetical protein
MSGWVQATPEPRRRALRRQEVLNGIDYVETGDDHRTLKVVLFRPPPEQLSRENFVVTGGTRVRNPPVIEIRLIEPSDPDLERGVRLVFAQPGDASTYRLQLHQVDGFDPRYAHIDFTFGDTVDRRIDCLPMQTGPQAVPPPPELDYLAKDYSGFRRLAFNRLAQTMSNWSERHVPDVVVMLIEMMAYVGDQLSYYQDAVATEAYLATARLRTSVRRHARLIDYTMHEGCNARAWVHLAVADDIVLQPEDKIRFAVGYEDPPAVEFAPMDPGPLHLFQSLNEIAFHAWGDGDCSLPRGCTSAALRDAWTEGGGKRRLDGLVAGQALLIETIAATDSREEPDPQQRHVVRLTHLSRTTDALYDFPVVEIRWAAEDALPFAVALPLPPGNSPAGDPAPAVAVARGNMILADQGRLVEDEILPNPHRRAAHQVNPDRNDNLPANLDLEAKFRGAANRTPIFAPRARHHTLHKQGLTFRQPLEPMTPAGSAVHQDVRRATPQVISLQGDRDPQFALQDGKPVFWTVQPDLIESGPEDCHFVIDIEDDGLATVRFGDNVRGARPGDQQMTITYRIGNGPEGNVGAETIIRVLTDDGVDVPGVSARNPLPATGGLPPESLTHVKLYAPNVFRGHRARSVTAEDYAHAAEEVFGVRRAAADLTQLGSIRLVRVVILPLHGDDPPHELLQRVRANLYRRRRIGHEVRVSEATLVALDVALTVSVRGGYLRGHVLAALRDVLGSGLQPDGSMGLFHPDRMSFGTPVYGSQIVATAQAVTGVEWVRLTRLRRLEDAAPDDEVQLARGAASLLLDPFEVARIDNDATHPERGHVEITLVGGR